MPEYLTPIYQQWMHEIDLLVMCLLHNHLMVCLISEVRLILQFRLLTGSECLLRLVWRSCVSMIPRHQDTRTVKKFDMFAYIVNVVSM
jgi:hypothetical protein